MSNWWAHPSLPASGLSSQTSIANASGSQQQQQSPQSLQSQLLLINELLEKERRAGEKIFNEFVSSFKAGQSPLQGAPLFYPPGNGPK
ncbi:hypothetical protein AAVH_37190 [Aphelenchoides avenae]|nr:hypothetical protein AAVH_37190 [Aphelenchus avenae]